MYHQNALNNDYSLQADLDGERFISDLHHNISRFGQFHVNNLRVWMNSYVRQQLHPCCFGFDTSMLLTRPVVFDAIMRVRTSTGVRPTDFFGAFYMVRSFIIDPLGQVDLIKYNFVYFK